MLVKPKFNRNNVAEGDEPLNKYVTLSALYRGIVKHYAKQNKYIDTLEEKVKSLQEENDRLKKKMAGYNQFGPVEDLHKRVTKLKEQHKSMVEMFQNFVKKHKNMNITLTDEDINKLFEQLKEYINNQQ